jgi:integrase/recombinase XerD
MAGNLYRRGKTYWGRVQVAGTEYRGSLHTRNRAEALKRLEIWREEVGRAKFYGAQRLTWADAVLHYTGGDMGGVSENTAKRYKVSFRQVLPHLEKYHLDQIGPRQIGELIAARRKEGATNATINRDLTAVSRVMAAGLGKGANDHNPAKDYDRSLNRERRAPIDLPTWDEVATAIAMAPTPLWGQIMDYAGKTGMRENEILTLEKKRVELARKAITLHRTKGRRLRVLPLTGPLLSEAVPILEAAMKRGETLVFGHKGDDTLKNFPSRYSAWRKKHKVRFRFHDLRHLFAVTYLQRGGNIYDLQRILGHRSIKTTEGYLEYLTPEERRKAMTGDAQIPAQP